MFYFLILKETDEEKYWGLCRLCLKHHKWLKMVIFILKIRPGESPNHNYMQFDINKAFDLDKNLIFLYALTICHRRNSKWLFYQGFKRK